MPIVPIIGIIVICVGFALLYRQRNIHNERMILEHRFEEIQNRCASAEATTRIIVASQLKEMSEQQYPGRGKKVTPENYPFFARVMETLCIIMSRETEMEVINTMQSMLESAVRFSTTRPRFLSGKSDRRMRNSLVNKLHNAHETTQKSLIEAMVQYWIFKSEPKGDSFTEVMEALIFCEPVSLHPNSYTEEKRRQFIAALYASPHFPRAMKRWERVKSGMADKPEQMKSEALLLAEMQTATDRYLAVKCILDYGRNYKDMTRIMVFDE